MDKSTHSISDVRAADRITFECLQRWHDPLSWQTHLLEATGDLLGLPVGLYAELDRFRPGEPTKILSAVEAGWESAEQRATFFGLHGSRNHRPGKHARQEPFESALYQALKFRFRECPEVVVCRHELIDDTAWSADPHYQQYWQPSGLRHSVISVRRLKLSDSVGILMFAGGDQKPDVREKAILDQIHDAVAITHYDRLTTWTHVSPLGLTPRQVDVFRLLLTGENEQVIAKQLHRSRATISEHICAIYQHFGVSSRGQLLAYLLNRDPRPNASATPPGVLS